MTYGPPMLFEPVHYIGKMLQIIGKLLQILDSGSTPNLEPTLNCFKIYANFLQWVPQAAATPPFIWPLVTSERHGPLQEKNRGSCREPTILWRIYSVLSVSTLPMHEQKSSILRHTDPTRHDLLDIPSNMFNHFWKNNINIQNRYKHIDSNHFKPIQNHSKPLLNHYKTITKQF